MKPKWSDPLIMIAIMLAITGVMALIGTFIGG